MSDDLQNRLSAASFAGTLAFGRLALAMLFAANGLAYLVSNGAKGSAGVALAIISAALSYAAQELYTRGCDRSGMVVHATVLVSAIASGAYFVMGGA